MKTSDKGLAFIARHEGIVLGPYLDSATPPVWTIGIGHTAAAGLPNPRGHPAITAAEAIEIFRRDVPKYEARVLRAVKVPLAQHEFDALVSFDYNTGGIHRARLVEHLNAGDRARAAEGLMGWLIPPEIEGRRTAEKRLFEAGDYGSGPIPLYRAVNGRAVRDGSISTADLQKQLSGGKSDMETPSAPPKSLSGTTNPLNPHSPLAALWRSIIALLGR